MESTPHGWKIFDRDMPVLLYEYSFGPGTANALAVKAERGLFVFSPPWKVGSGVLDDLAPYGKVVALVATGALHHLGIPEWKDACPDATIYAPAQSVARVAKKTRLAIRPLSEAAALAGANVELVDMPHYKTGEALVRIRSARGMAWYVTDCIMNMRELPSHPIGKLVFKLTRSAPGLKFNNLTALFMVKDKRALKAWLAAEFDRAPPRWLIAAHGDIADVGADPAAARRLFATS